MFAKTGLEQFYGKNEKRPADFRGYPAFKWDPRKTICLDQQVS